MEKLKRRSILLPNPFIFHTISDIRPRTEAEIHPVGIQLQKGDSPMALKQDLQKIQRQLDKLAKQTEKLATTIEKQETKKAVKPKVTRAARIKSGPKKAATPKKPVAKKPAKTTPIAPASDSAKVSDTEKVLNMIKASPEGIQVKTIKAETGLDAKKIANILYKACKAGQIKAIARGLYAVV